MARSDIEKICAKMARSDIEKICAKMARSDIEKGLCQDGTKTQRRGYEIWQLEL